MRSLLHTEQAIYRILDANCNRLREALRVIEEYYRFAVGDTDAAIELKANRHVLSEIERLLQAERLLASRDTASDCFADRNRPEELERDGVASLLTANFKRAQEAARVIEEYAKLTDVPQTSEKAKTIRFSLYSIEQKQTSGQKNGKK